MTTRERPLQDQTGRALRRARWLLSELHGGNEFSKADLWNWLQEIERAYDAHNRKESGNGPERRADRIA